MRLGGGCWRKDCSCLSEQPGVGEKGYSPSAPPPPKILQAWYRYMNRSSSRGAGTDFPSSALSQLWRKGSAPGSLLNYSLLKGGRGAVRVRLLLSPASQGCLYPFHHFHGRYVRLPQCKSTVTPTGRVEVGEEQREGEWKGVHPSKAPTQEGKSSAQLLRSFTLSKPALADRRCKAGPQLPPTPSPAAPAPSTARTLSSACPEPATAPATFSQGIPGGVCWGGGCYGPSPHCTAGKLRQGPLSRAPVSGGQVHLPLASLRAQGHQGPARSCHCHPPKEDTALPPALFPLEIWI